MNDPNTIKQQRRRDLRVALACGVFVGVMVGAAYAAVPFYNWFCRTTGFAGTPQVATAAPSQVLDRKINVRFDANVTGGLPWRFEPEQNSIEVKIGQVVTVYFSATNLSAREITVDGTGLSSRIAKGATHEPSKQSKPRSSTEAGPT